MDPCCSGGPGWGKYKQIPKIPKLELSKRNGQICEFWGPQQTQTIFQRPQIETDGGRYGTLTNTNQVLAFQTIDFNNFRLRRRRNNIPRCPQLEFVAPCTEPQTIQMNSFHLKITDLVLFKVCVRKVVYTYACIYIYRERGRERERDRHALCICICIYIYIYIYVL